MIGRAAGMCMRAILSKGHTHTAPRHRNNGSKQKQPIWLLSTMVCALHARRGAPVEMLLVWLRLQAGCCSTGPTHGGRKGRPPGVGWRASMLFGRGGLGGRTKRETIESLRCPGAPNLPTLGDPAGCLAVLLVLLVLLVAAAAAAAAAGQRWWWCAGRARPVAAAGSGRASSRLRRRGGWNLFGRPIGTQLRRRRRQRGDVVAVFSARAQGSPQPSSLGVARPWPRQRLGGGGRRSSRWR